MGSILITVPDIRDADLIYNEDETRRILRFFWPWLASQFDDLSIANDVRRFAQTMLIAAVDGSYAMGYVAGLWDLLSHALTHPNASVLDLVKRLARNYVKLWWRHATKQDLENPRIYETVRNAVAYGNAGLVQDIIAGKLSALKRGGTTLAFVANTKAAA